MAGGVAGGAAGGAVGAAQAVVEEPLSSLLTQLLTPSVGVDDPPADADAADAPTVSTIAVCGLQHGLQAALAADSAMAQAVVEVVVATPELWRAVVGTILDADPGSSFAKAFTKMKARSRMGRRFYWV